MDQNIKNFLRNILTIEVLDLNRLKETALDLLLDDAKAAAKTEAASKIARVNIRVSTLGGEGYTIDLQQKGEVEAILAGGMTRKIEAIKKLREFAGCGLKEAKDACDNWELWNK